MPELEELQLGYNENFGDAGMRALFEGLGRSALPSLRNLFLYEVQLGPAGAEVLAAALRQGAMPQVEKLQLGSNRLGNQGLSRLNGLLRKLPNLDGLYLGDNGIDDEGVASLVANLRKDDFKKLEQLDLNANIVADKSSATLESAIRNGLFPAMGELTLCKSWQESGVNVSGLSDEALKSLDGALAARPFLQYEPAEDFESLLEEARELLGPLTRFEVIKALRNNDGNVHEAMNELIRATGHEPAEEDEESDSADF